VIAIIGILAAVLVPSLSGYIARTKKTAVEQEAKAISTIYEAWLIDPDENVESEGFGSAEAATTVFATYYTSIGNAELPDGLTITVDTSNRPIGFKYEENGYIATYTNGGTLDVNEKP
jgi:type II secretory pathway pseudopilin PulG